MSSRTYQAPETTLTPTRTWGGAIAVGLVAGVGMGLIMHYVMGAMPLVGALYGQPSVTAGWVAHLFHSVAFALVFVTIVTNTSLRDYGAFGLIGPGVVYGIVLEAVVIAMTRERSMTPETPEPEEFEEPAA